MKHVLVLTAISLLATILLAGCGSSDYTARGGGDYVNRLESEGLTLVPSGVANIREFSVTGQRYSVGRGGVLHIYEYETEDEASMDVARTGAGIAGDAHVYQSGPVVAVYLGTALTVQTTLNQVFGPRIY